MAEIKTRFPYRLSDEDYDEWFTRWASWFLMFPNTTEFANWLRSGINPLDADFHDKFMAVQEAKITQDAATEMWNLAAKALRQLLIKLRISLPTLTPGDDSVLDTLVLRGEVPSRDVDKLLIYAELVDNAWQPISADPQFAPFADRLNLIAPLMTDVNDKRIVMGKAILDYSTVCDEKTDAREACNTRERAVFNFFRGEGKPNEFWTSSVYGLPGGGNGGGDGSKWDDVPGEVKIQFVILGKEMLVISAPGYTGAVGFDVRLAWGPTGGEPPTMSGENTLTNVPFPVQYTEEIFHGMTCYAWIRARNGEEVTGWSEPASVDVP